MMIVGNTLIRDSRRCLYRRLFATMNQAQLERHKLEKRLAKAAAKKAERMERFVVVDGGLPLDDGIRWCRNLTTTWMLAHIGGDSISMEFTLALSRRKSNHNLRGYHMVPYAADKYSVAVFAEGAKADEAREAGATIVGSKDLIEMIQNGEFQFDRVLATPDMMPLIGRVARILGPLGLVPNPKHGSLTLDIGEAVRDVNRRIRIVSDENGIVALNVARTGWSVDEIRENIESVITAINDMKPNGVKGRHFFLKCEMRSTTMPYSIMIDVTQPPFKLNLSGGANQ